MSIFTDKLKIIAPAMLVLLLVAACQSATLSDAPPTAPPATATASGPTATPSFTDQLAAGARHVRGNPDAPVTVIEFSDFK